jgi:hypothetical protein
LNKAILIQHVRLCSSTMLRTMRVHHRDRCFSSRMSSTRSKTNSRSDGALIAIVRHDEHVNGCNLAGEYMYRLTLRTRDATALDEERPYFVGVSEWNGEYRRSASRVVRACERYTSTAWRVDAEHQPSSTCNNE